MMCYLCSVILQSMITSSVLCVPNHVTTFFKSKYCCSFLLWKAPVAYVTKTDELVFYQYFIFHCDLSCSLRTAVI